MTDKKIREFFKDSFGGDFFSAYNYTFGFLKFVQDEINEVIDSLCNEKNLSRVNAIEFLQNLHGRKRSLAKLAGEYHFVSERE